MKKVFINDRMNYINVIYGLTETAAQNARNGAINEVSRRAQEFA
jgi:hypothetical protein